ncbi:phosphoribosyltransferase [Roseibium suaedae]|uniref:Phosphoribosyl transferase domain-containing protein n=1 Tax=Roseibium suaedae TaxID=735517 RepID=A0A1M7NVG6_9HYPH|nr:phosphoribosyltransferase [Roseibium suaedae]SHN07960.1 Phosphoribosyl transferase domain-containing protein [Roseibium suaedae]
MSHNTPPAAPHEFWQELLPAQSFDDSMSHDRFFPVTLEDGRQLCLPIRPLADGEHALASIIINQASFDVLEVLAEILARKLAPFEPDVVAGLPTLGLALAAEVARKLGHSRYVPLGTSRKFWYEEELSVPLSSITTPDQIKRLYVDPRMLPLLEGRRIALVDDVISSGTSICAGLDLLKKQDLEPVVIGAAMLQSNRWRENPALAPFQDRIRSCFSTPLLSKATEGGWTAG